MATTSPRLMPEGPEAERLPRSGGNATPTSLTAPVLTPADFRVWQDWIHQRCGWLVPAERMTQLSGLLWRGMQRCGASSFIEYHYRVAFHAQGEREGQELLLGLLNHETSFFRHRPSFEALGQQVVPEAARRTATNPLRLWSAGCASGQEAYSLALQLWVGGEGGNLPFEVIGTDLSPTILERARAGCYSEREVRSVPEPLLRRYFRCVGQQPLVYRVCAALRERVRFFTGNLVELASYPVVAQDAIFCHNVLIYFSPARRLEVINHLAGRLAHGGILCLGPCDALGLDVRPLELQRCGDALIYRRRA